MGKSEMMLSSQWLATEAFRGWLLVAASQSIFYRLWKAKMDLGRRRFAHTAVTQCIKDGLQPSGNVVGFARLPSPSEHWVVVVVMVVGQQKAVTDGDGSSLCWLRQKVGEVDPTAVGTEYGGLRIIERS
jgi:hypothetical protein